MKSLILKKGEDRRIREGHLWIFSNEVDTARSPLKAFAAGETARVEASGGRPLGVAAVNPAALICGRMLSGDPSRRLDEGLLRERIQAALQLRERFFPTPHYRLVFSEGDLLPGLIADRFGDIVSLQATTAAMDRMLPVIAKVLEDLIAPAGILCKNDSSMRELEGLARQVNVLSGTVPDQAEVLENGCRFSVPLAAGQKTGWYYDMRANRGSLLPLAAGRSVLDVFSYVGALGVAAAKAGAANVLCLDASQPALDCLAQNAESNGVADRVETMKGDAFERMAELRDQGRRFEVVSLDPPAFIKRRKDAEAGMAAYRKANRLALELVENGGYLLTCSCSQHLTREDLRRVLARSAQDAGVVAQIVAQGHQDSDHPVHPAMPETDYLKGFLARVLRPGQA